MKAQAIQHRPTAADLIILGLMAPIVLVIAAATLFALSVQAIIEKAAT